MFIERVIERLQTLSSSERAKGLNALARALIYSELNGEERGLVERTLVRALDDPSCQVRRSIAEAYADEPTAPRHIVHLLAHDQLSVSEPILVHSALLSEAQLINILSTADETTRNVVAGRRHLSMGIGNTIAEVAGPSACLTLLRNPHAILTINAVALMADRHGQDGDLREELLGRTDLPSDIRHTLVSALGSVLKDFVVDRDWVPSQKMESVVEDATEKAALTLLDHQDPEDIEALLRQLHDDQKLNAHLLLRALCVGNISVLEGGIALLAAQPRNRVFALLMHGSKASVSGLLKRCGVTPRVIPLFQTALDVYRGLVSEASFDDHRRLALTMIERTLTSYEQIADEDADDLLVLLRHFEADIARDDARRGSGKEISVAA